MDLVLENTVPPVAVAVSGGSDSLALALLAHTWAQSKQGHIIALTVDHGLRTESADEAKQVSFWLAKRGIKHVILKWDKEKPLTHLQERAREARYTLLTSWCKTHGISTLLLGHHQQDQEETFWLRLAAGSGLDGLTAMKELSLRDGITLMRPLLSRSKAELEAFLSAQNQEWLIDPSNEQSRFFRGKLRTVLEEEGLTTFRLEKTIHKLREDFDFIQQNLHDALGRVVVHHEEGFISLDRKAFELLHPSLSKRLLSLCMRWFSSSSYPPRTQTLLNILDKLKSPFPFTAGGIYWFSQAGRLYLSRELKAAAPPLALKSLQHPTTWDHRFCIQPDLKENFPEEAFIAPLGSPISPDIPKTQFPVRLLPSFPAIWMEEKIAAIPHLCYTSLNYRKDLKKFISIRPLFHDSLRFTI